jgi:hypothetical protein
MAPMACEPVHRMSEILVFAVMHCARSIRNSWRNEEIARQGRICFADLHGGARGARRAPRAEALHYLQKAHEQRDTPLVHV